MTLRRGYTLIEMLAVILILAMSAAIAVPNVASFLKSERKRAFLNSLVSLSLEARNQAVRTSQIVELTSDGDDGFQIRQTDQNATDNQVIQSVRKTPGLQASRFRTGADEVGAGDWRIRFYPDGTADAGNVEIAEGNDVWSFAVDRKTGRGSVRRGVAEDEASTEWPVGDYVQRT